MLQVNNIEVYYSEVILVLKGCSIEVPDGAVHTLLGGNGGGKTTMLKAISGLLKTEDGRVTDGSIYFNGQRIDNAPPERIAKMGIAQVMEGRLPLEHLTVEENLKVGGYLYWGANQKKDLDRVYYYFPRLKELRHRTSGYLSGGELQMMVMGRGMMTHPRLMLLDEPSMGLSPVLRKEIFDIVGWINAEEKVSILLVEQNAMLALTVAEYGYVMEDGRIVLDGPIDKLMDNPDVREFYIGMHGVAGDKRKSYKDIKHYKRRKRWL